MSLPSLKARMRKIAARLQVCPIHELPLRCGPCWFYWDGTEEEFWELSPLVARMEPFLEHLAPSGQVCPACQTDLWCRLCYEAETALVKMPDDLFTPEEYARYDALIAHMRERDTPKPRAWDHGLGP